MRCCAVFQRHKKIQTLKTHYFTLTYDCRICSPGKAGERRRARLHTTVGCSHGDERRKYDSKRFSSHAEAYVKLQSFNIAYLYTVYMYVNVVYYHVNTGQMSSTACVSDSPPTFHFPSPNIPFFSFHSLLFPPLFLSYQLSSLSFPLYALNAGWKLES